jgi:hypothetical protein
MTNGTVTSENPEENDSQPAGDSGSSEALAEQPLRIADRLTGATIVIYESVLNERRQGKKQFSELRAMIAPLGVISNDQPLRKSARAIPGETRCSIELICFHDRMEEQAMHALTNKYSGRSEGEFVADRTNVSKMTHQMVRFRVLDFPNARIESIGSGWPKIT